MVQVFGNRILGGIGAPESRAGEAFGAGVSTALGQRRTRQAMDETAQAMRLRDIDLQWATEDREEAKRRRAAAEAAAAAARARGIAAVEGMRSAQPFFRLGATGGGAPTGGGATAPARGAAMPFSTGVSSTSGFTGVTAPAGRTVTGGGGDTRMAGSPGADVLGAPAASRFRPAPRQAAGTPTAGYEPMPTQSRFPSAGAPAAYATPSGAIGVPAVPIGRPGDFAARAAAGQLALAQRVTAGGYNPNIPMAGLIAGQEDRVRLAQERFNRDPSGENLQAYTEAKAELDQMLAELGQQQYDTALVTQPGYTDRGVLALEGPESVGRAITGRIPAAPTAPTAPAAPAAPAGDARMGAPTVTIQGPNGAVTVPAEAPETELAAPIGAEPLTLPGAAPIGQTPSAQLGFGPRLGAAPTPTEQFLAGVGAAPAGQVDLATLAASYNSPLYDPMFAQLAEQQRAAFAYAAEYAASQGDIAGYIEATAKVREQEMLILTQQLVVGIDEAVNFNSPQRLSAVASMVYGGRDVFVAPKGDGTADIYLDGELARTGADLNEFASGLRGLVDAEYRSQMAAAAAEREKFVFEKRTEADIAAERDIAVARGKALNEVQIDQLRAYLQSQGLLPPEPAEYEFIEGPDNSSVTLFNKRTGARELTYLFNVDPATGQTTVQELRE